VSVNSDGVRRWSRRKEQDAGNVNGGALVWVQDDAPQTTCEGVDYYTHSAVVADGAYSIEVTTYPDDGKVAGYNVAFSQDGVEWHELGNRLGLGGGQVAGATARRQKRAAGRVLDRRARPGRRRS
jgi:hypothetical protein